MMESERSHPAPLIFGRLFSRLFGTEEPANAQKAEDPAGAIGPLNSLERELDEISRRADASVRDLDSQAKRTTGAGGAPADDGEKARLHGARDSARLVMARDIALLHEQLGTGIDTPQMARLRSLLEAHAPGIEEPSRPEVDERIERHVLQNLYARSVEEAWRRFETLVEESGLVWPLQEGHSESLPPEEIDRLREKHHKEIRATFLAASAQHTAELIQGEVRAWGSSYPDMHSYLWLQTVFRGVAAALCAQFFAAALEIWLWRSHEAEREFLAAVAQRLAALRSSASGESGSRSKAAEVTAQVDEICGIVIPDVVWAYIAPKLSWARAGEPAPAISVLASGLSPLDPVCGMLLTPERVAAQMEVEGRRLYFCSISCRQRFEETVMHSNHVIDPCS
jgi:YHS domain-containing protein